MLYSAAHNVCVYDTPEPALIGNAVPEARLINGSKVAVPCTIPNMQIMRKLGHEAVSPILNDYDWPHCHFKFDKPFEHQRHMAAFLTLHPRAFNLSDMGTGKTLAALWAWDYLMCKGIIKKVLILAPLSTIYRVWEDEIFTHFLSRRKCVIVYGSRERRLERLSLDADFYIINHDGLAIGATNTPRGIALGDLAEQIRDREDIDAIGVDEGSVYKDGTTKRYKVLRGAVSRKTWLWWFTGTPVPVEPPNAWSQARLVRQEYQESYQGFRTRTMYKFSNFKWKPKNGSYEAAAQILQPAIRFKRDDCLDLPDVMIQTRDIELSPTQRAAYDELKKTLKTEIGKGQITAINEATLRTKLIQISCGAVYGPQHEVNKVDCAPRLSVLREVIEQTQYKLLVFAPLTSVIDMLYHELKDEYSVERITGNVTAARRNEIFRAFQNDQDPRIIVADPGTMAHGLTLTAASTTVWYGPTDKPELYQQANKRMDRPGQKNRMLIMRLAATPIEREIYRRLDARENMQGVILNLIKEG